mmetsp:Transcript_24773/g.46587  ORF Transcript_24773/g.46587 Transcript_24773/m.46587 type:complete len:494 (+) Transcript_24773:161-1642(+)
MALELPPSSIFSPSAPATISAIQTETTKYEKDLLMKMGTAPNDPITLGAMASYLSLQPNRYAETVEYFERCLVNCCTGGDIRSDVDDSYKLVYSTYVSLYASFLCSCSNDDISDPSFVGDYKKAGSGSTSLLEKIDLLYRRSVEEHDNEPNPINDTPVFLHRNVKDYKKADQMYESFLDSHPEAASVWSKYGNFLKSVKKDVKAAEAAYLKGIKAGPTNVECLTAYAVFLHGTLQNYSKAEVYYSRAYEVDPFHVNNLSNYGLFLSEIKCDFEKSEEMYQRAMKIDPNHHNSIYNYAVLLDSGIKDKSKAEEYYTRCLEVNPNHCFCLYNLAILVEEVRGSTASGKSEAEALFIKAVQASHNDPMTIADYGRFLLVCLDDVERAKKELMKAIEIDGNCVVGNYNLGVVEYNAGKFSGALKYFGKVLKREGNHWESMRWSARCCVKEGRRKEAENFYEMCRKNVPEEDRGGVNAEIEDFKKGGKGGGGKRRGSK